MLMFICGAGSMTEAQAQYNPFLPINVSSIYRQPFEKYGSNGSFNGWTGNLAINDVNSRSKSGPTPSAGTGPSYARDGGTYMYVEASSPTLPQSEAVLASPIFNLSGLTHPVISIYYHMNGSQMGTLRLEYSLNYSSNWTTVWTISGNRGPNWIYKFVNLPNLNNQSSVRFRFRATTGSGFRSDIAIDRFRITDRYGKTEQESAPSVQNEVEANAVSLSAFPNPFHKELHVEVPEHDTEVTLTLYNLQGQRMIEKRVGVNAGSIRLDTEQLSAGTYLLNVSGEGRSKTLRVVHE